VAVEHLVTDGPFEAGDLLADGRLGEAEAFRRLAERALLGHGHQCAELAEFDVAEHEIIISIHDDNDKRSSLYVMIIGGAR
jgi:hypothetical protein